MDLRGSPPWFGAVTVNSIFCTNRFPRSSQKFLFWGMVIFYGFEPFFVPKGTHWPKMDPRGSPPWFGAITVNSIFCPNRWVKNSNFGAWQFFTVLTHFLAPIAPHWPQDGPQGFPNVIWRHNRKFDFLPKSDCGVVKNSNFGAWQFFTVLTNFGPNGNPLAPRWTLGVSYCDLAP